MGRFLSTDFPSTPGPAAAAGESQELRAEWAGREEAWCAQQPVGSTCRRGVVLNALQA